MNVDDNNLSDAPDEVLVERARDGDQDAFGILFLRYQEEIYRCLMQIVRNDDIVKDLWQETCVKAWRHIGKLNELSQFKAWLISIARHLAISWLRRNPVGRTVSLEKDGSLPDPIDKDADPQAMIEREYVRHVLAEMKPVLRAILILSATGYSPAEIAHQRGYTEGTVIAYRARARRQFRQLYFTLADRTGETQKEK
jgi:RNA polymerase sigma-70 factor (ECF subfamily)